MFKFRILLEHSSNKLGNFYSDFNSAEIHDVSQRYREIEKGFYFFFIFFQTNDLNIQLNIRLLRVYCFTMKIFQTRGPFK